MNQFVTDHPDFSVFVLIVCAWVIGTVAEQISLAVRRSK